jgi:DNA-binding response OmpR family regulator
MPAMNPTRLLLLEDEPVSAMFLRDALAPVARVDVAITCAQAEALAGAHHRVWLFDASLPDGRACELLPRLRARGLDVPALALTADPDADGAQRLHAAGFARVLVKPLDGAELRRVVRSLLPNDGAALWDDARALPALAGRDDALAALRGLFLRDLPRQMHAVREAVARRDFAEARAELHRLKAGCGFVGATALAAAVAALHADPGHAPALEDFLRHGQRQLGEA